MKFSESRLKTVIWTIRQLDSELPLLAQSRPSAQSVRPLHARSGCCGPLGAIVNQGRHIPQNIDWRHFRRNAAARSFIPVAELSEPGIIDFVSPRIADTLRPTAKRYSSPA